MRQILMCRDLARVGLKQFAPGLVFLILSMGLNGENATELPKCPKSLL